MTVAAPPRPDLSPEARFARRQRRIARAIGLVVMLAGALNIASALTPALRDRISLVDTAFDGSVSDLAAGATALIGAALLLLGRGLTHRLAKGLDVEEAVVMALVGALLWRCRGVFGEQVPRVRATSVLRWAPRLLLITFAYGIVGLVLRRNRISPDLTPVLAVREVVARMFGFSGPLTISGKFGTWFPASLTVLGISALVALVLLALAPVADRFVVHDEERSRVRGLVARPDGDTLDPFALRHDKRYVFSADGRAVVAYRYVNGVGLAAGDPVGDPESAPDAVRRFLARCDAHGWRPAAISVRGDRLDLWLEQGMRVQYLGDEAVIDVAGFHLDGRPMRPVRQAVSRTRRHGITTEVHREGSLDPTLRRALVGISEAHLDGHADRGSPAMRPARRSRSSATCPAGAAAASRSTRCAATTPATRT
jgi:lysyl-tRNA synthetase class 2